MFPSSEDKRMRSDALVSLDEPASLDCPTPTLEAVCVYLVARLRYDFVSGRDMIAAYVDITTPWNDSSYPQIPAHGIIGMYCPLLEGAVFSALSRSLPIVTADPTIHFFFTKVVIKNLHQGVFRICISGDVVNHPVLAAA